MTIFIQKFILLTPTKFENLGVLGGENGVRFRLYKSLDKQKVKSPKMTIFIKKFILLTHPKIENLWVLGGKVVLDFDFIRAWTSRK